MVKSEESPPGARDFVLCLCVGVAAVTLLGRCFNYAQDLVEIWFSACLRYREQPQAAGREDLGLLGEIETRACRAMIIMAIKRMASAACRSLQAVKHR